jgi:hypothetical protein
LRFEDDLKEAARLDRLEAPTPEQRAKAAKIRLKHCFPGVKFDPTTAYHTIRKYGRLANGRDLYAKLRYQAFIKLQQREKNASMLKEDLLAIHHLSKEAQRIELLLGTGILDLIDGEYYDRSPELVRMKEFCIEYAKPFVNLLGLTMKAGQTAIQIYCKLLSKLGLKTSSSRPGTGKNRPRYYRVLSTTDIGNQIVACDERIPELKRSYNTEQSRLSVLEGQHLQRIELLAQVQVKAESLSPEQISRAHSWSDGRLAGLKVRIERSYQEYLKSEANLVRVRKNKAKLENQLKIDQNSQILANLLQVEMTIVRLEAKLAESKNGILRLEAKLGDIQKSQAILKLEIKRQKITADSALRLERKTAQVESIERRLSRTKQKLPQLSKDYEAVEVGELLYAAALKRLEVASTTFIKKDVFSLSLALLSWGVFSLSLFLAELVFPEPDVKFLDPIQIDIWGNVA